MSVRNFCSINLYNLSVLAKPRKSLLRRSRLISDYLRITFKDIFLNKMLKKKWQIEKIYGNDVHFLDYELLRSLFEEIFIEEQYMFFPEKKNPMIIDCGTNIGTGVVYFKSVYPESRIICFEPDPVTYNVLNQNIVANKFTDVVTHQNAVSGKKMTLDFFVESDNQSSLGMSLYEESLEKNRKNKKKISVESVLLSDYITETVDLLKIDVEGAEFDVFAELDAKDKMKHVNQIIIEGHVFNDEMRRKIQDLIGILEKNNFQYLITNPFGLSNITNVDNWKFMLYASKKQM